MECGWEDRVVKRIISLVAHVIYMPPRNHRHNRRALSQIVIELYAQNLEA